MRSFIGVNEELVKFLPLASYIYCKRPFNELTEGSLYFGLAGVWFGIIENIYYTISYGAEVGILRVVLLPFLHASLTALAGYGLIRVKILNKNIIEAALFLAGSVVIHGVYDFLLFSGVPSLILLANLFLLLINALVFALFKNAQKGDVRRGASQAPTTPCWNCQFNNIETAQYCANCQQRVYG